MISSLLLVAVIETLDQVRLRVLAPADDYGDRTALLVVMPLNCVNL